MAADYTPMGYKRLGVAGLGSETGDGGRADQAISAIMTIESVLTTACEITAGQIEPERSRIQACTTPTTKAKRTSGGQMGEPEDGRADQPGEHRPVAAQGPEQHAAEQQAGPDAQAGWVVRARLPRPGGSS